jgi:hypothetical protein
VAEVAKLILARRLSQEMKRQRLNAPLRDLWSGKKLDSDDDCATQ